jgi:hypothetical protein
MTTTDPLGSRSFFCLRGNAARDLSTEAECLSRVSNGRRSKDAGNSLHVELGDGEDVAHDPDGPFTCENVIKQRCGNGRGSAPWTWLASAGFAMSSNRSSVPTRTSGADRFGAVPPIVFWPV